MKTPLFISTFSWQKVWPWAIGLFVSLAYVLPWWWMGMDSHPVIHDNFDANWSWWVILQHEGMWHAPSGAVVPGLMNGAPRICLGSEYYLPALMVRGFGLVRGWLLTETVIRFVAFCGCWHILNLLPKRFGCYIPKWAKPLLCCAFTWLPFYSTLGLAIAGMPALAALMYTVYRYPRRRNSWISAAIYIFLYALGSSLVTSGLFVLSALLFVPFFVNWKGVLKRDKWPYWLLVMWLAVCYIGVDYRLLDFIIHPQWVSQRSEALLKLGDWSYVWKKRILPNILSGQYHAASGQSVILWWVLLALLAIWYGTRLLGVSIKPYVQRTYHMLFWLLAVTVLLSTFYGIRYWVVVDNLTQLWPTLHQFNWGRYHFFHPLLWWLITVFVFSIFYRVTYKFIGRVNQSRGTLSQGWFTSSLLVTIVSLLFIAGVLGSLVVRHPEYSFRSELSGVSRPSLTEFLAPDLYAQARELISVVPNAGVIHIGLHPAASQVAHIPTVDHYLALYPLRYKHQWEKLLDKTWVASSEIQHYFNTSANRCYAFHPELGLSITPYLLTPPNEPISPPLLNSHALASIGATHLFSIAPLAKPDNPKRAMDKALVEGVNFELLNIFTSPEIPWQLYVYRVKKA